ncbi:MAG: hypothetical protein EXR74_05785 [Bdellovibrionales bacterium]|nr:hypothetical protein [Bdellovibrionales bacterium]
MSNTEGEFHQTQFSGTGEVSEMLPLASLEAEGDLSFQPKQYSKTESSAPLLNNQFEEKQEIKKTDFFTLPSIFWDSFNSDKELAREIEKVVVQEVEKRVRVTVENRLNEAAPIYRAERQQEGYEAGKVQAEQEYSQLKEELKNEVKSQIDSFISEKQALLQSHQPIWLEAMSVLMKKFIVKNAGQIEAGIQNWLQTQVVNFSSDAKLLLIVPESQYVRLEKLGFLPLAQEFEFVKDCSLKPGEFKVECSAGGVFFSSEKEMEKLEQMLNEICHVEDLPIA